MTTQPKTTWRKVKLGEVELDVFALLSGTLKTTLERDGDILSLGSGRIERLFVGRWACNIETMVKNICAEDTDIRVDAPYNKHGDGPKGFELDLAIHKRGIDSNNLLAMEVETTNSPKRDDLEKLKALTTQNGDFEYQRGLFIVFGVEKSAGKILDEEWYIDGKANQEIGTPLSEVFNR